MGCNTSKESVQPAAEEAKEDAKNGDIPKTTKNGTSEAESQEKSKEAAETEQKEEEDQGESGKEEAATRIQAAFRGHHARKSMKEAEATQKQPAKATSNLEPTKEQLQEEFREDDKELCDAATKIQASFRGHMSRKEQTVSGVVKSTEQLVDNIATKIDEKVADTLNELEGIDLTDPDLHKAATKIQASFRGHKVRQEVPATVPVTAPVTSPSVTKPAETKK